MPLIRYHRRLLRLRAVTVFFPGTSCLTKYLYAISESAAFLLRFSDHSGGDGESDGRLHTERLHNATFLFHLITGAAALSGVMEGQAIQPR